MYFGERICDMQKVHVVDFSIAAIESYFYPRSEIFIDSHFLSYYDWLDRLQERDGSLDKLGHIMLSLAEVSLKR